MKQSIRTEYWQGTPAQASEGCGPRASGFGSRKLKLFWNLELGTWSFFSRLILGVAMLLTPISLHADTASLLFSISNSWNRIFDPAPTAIPGVSDYQSLSIAI